MGYGTDGLTFNTLRGANLARLPEFKNAKSELAHQKPDGSDWSLNDWMVAVVGEMGEASNILKKVRRGDLSIEEAKLSLAKEFADVVTYLDILSFQCDIDLGRAIQAKFNEVSEKVGSRIYISSGDWHYKEIK